LNFRAEFLEAADFALDESISDTRKAV